MSAREQSRSDAASDNCHGCAHARTVTEPRLWCAKAGSTVPEHAESIPCTGFAPASTACPSSSADPRDGAGVQAQLTATLRAWQDAAGQNAEKGDMIRDLLALLCDISNLWPVINCVCGRAPKRLPQEIADRVRSAVRAAGVEPKP